jgi:hypothetical protein
MKGGVDVLFPLEEDLYLFQIKHECPEEATSPAILADATILFTSLIQVGREGRIGEGREGRGERKEGRGGEKGSNEPGMWEGRGKGSKERSRRREDRG